MKRIHSFISSVALVVAFSPVFAHDMDGNPDLKDSILNMHDSHFPHQPGDMHAAAKGSGDTYGSVLLDKGPHTPHQPGDTHKSEKGKGDAYGTILNNL
jgi:hypothetical protein